MVNSLHSKPVEVVGSSTLYRFGIKLRVDLINRGKQKSFEKFTIFQLKLLSTYLAAVLHVQRIALSLTVLFLEVPWVDEWR